eukprot:449676_1
MEFIITNIFKIQDPKTIRRADSALSCVLALLDISTDINTIVRLYSYDGEYSCSYNCPVFLASILLAFCVYSMITQSIYVWQRYDNSLLYTLLSCIGFAPVVVTIDFWNDIENDDKYRKFFIIRWMETTNEALPAATIQMVIVLFFSEQAFDLNRNGLSLTIASILISIFLSLWSVGNGTRRYVAFVGGFKKTKLYYWSLALYTATDMFNRAMFMALFFVTALNVQNYDAYIITIIFLAIIHQIIFVVISRQRNTKNGEDDGCFGKLISTNWVTFGVFIMFYNILPSSVIFLRNFHVETAKISFLLIWINGISLIFSAILFWLIRVFAVNNNLSNNYFAAIIYLLAFNTIPFICVLFGRKKVRERVEEYKGFTLTFADIQMTVKQEKIQRAKREKMRHKIVEKERKKAAEERAQKELEFQLKMEKLEKKKMNKRQETEELIKKRQEEREEKEKQRQQRLEQQRSDGKKSYQLKKEQMLEKEERRKEKERKQNSSLVSVSGMMVNQMELNQTTIDMSVLEEEEIIDENKDKEKSKIKKRKKLSMSFKKNDEM